MSKNTVDLDPSFTDVLGFHRYLTEQDVRGVEVLQWSRQFPLSLWVPGHLPIHQRELLSMLNNEKWEGMECTGRGKAKEALTSGREWSAPEEEKQKKH